jgi:hypothetical protein
VHTCPDCGERLPTLGGLEIHHALAHAPSHPAAAQGPSPESHGATPATRGPFLADVDRPTRRRWGSDPTVPLTAVMVLALLLGAVAAAVARSHSASTTVATAGASAPSASPDASGSPQPRGVAVPLDAVTKARQQYLQVAATSNAELDRLKRQAPTSVSPAQARDFFARYAATLRTFDHGLRAITLPGSVQPYAQALLNDDAQLEAGFDRVVRDPGCGCEVLQNLEAVQARMSADIQHLRVALGLPPSAG